MSQSELLSIENISSFAKKFAEKLQPNDLVILRGDLGAGKTTLVAEIAKHLGVSATVNSPTFVYLQIYEGTSPIYHFDLYRLDHEKEFLEKGFDEYLHSNGITFIEWPEKIPNLIPKSRKELHLKILDENTREVTWQA